jgi:tRNA threonylcarbamoyladenosine biosynthesis protein TsaB
MSLILSIETSTKVCSVALYDENVLLACHDVLVEKSHSRIITVLIDNILKSTDHKMEDIQAVAVSKGPGSYTGLRIGVSTAKGLCYALDKPLIGINTLEAMAFEVNRYSTSKNLICPMLDARRMEVYCAMFDSDNSLVHETEARVMDENSFAEILNTKKIVFFGDGAFKCKTLLSKFSNALFLDNIYPSAKNIGYLAFKKFMDESFEDTTYFEPFYLKDFLSKN